MARLVFNINASPYIHSLNQIYSPKSIRCFGRYCAYHWVKNAFSGPSTVSAQNHPSTARTYIWCGCSSCCGPTGLLVVYVCVWTGAGCEPSNTQRLWGHSHSQTHTYSRCESSRASHAISILRRRTSKRAGESRLCHHRATIAECIYIVHCSPETRQAAGHTKEKKITTWKKNPLKAPAKPNTRTMGAGTLEADPSRLLHRLLLRDAA